MNSVGGHVIFNNLFRERVQASLQKLCHRGVIWVEAGGTRQEVAPSISRWSSRVTEVTPSPLTTTERKNTLAVNGEISDLETNKISSWKCPFETVMILCDALHRQRRLCLLKCGKKWTLITIFVHPCVQLNLQTNCYFQAASANTLHSLFSALNLCQLI